MNAGWKPALLSSRSQAEPGNVSASEAPASLSMGRFASKQWRGERRTSSLYNKPEGATEKKELPLNSCPPAGVGQRRATSPVVLVRYAENYFLVLICRARYYIHQT